MGVYAAADGGYVTTAEVNGTEQEISDGAWGCIAYSPITSLTEADMALAFEYTLDGNYEFSTDFQAQLARYLSEEYREYINGQNLTVAESDVALTIEYDPDAYPETNGYYGSYLDPYLAEFTQNLQWYLDNLDYGTDLSAWVSLENGTVSFSLADAAAYRTAGASKAMPGFDVIDYGQEDYVFGDATRDACHWDSYLLQVLETHADTLAPLFNQSVAS